MNPLMIRKIIHNITYVFDGKLSDIINKMQAWAGEYPEYSELEIEQDHDGNSFVYYLIGKRLETSDETTKRLEGEALMASREEERDKRQYEFLKKKFG